MTASSMIKNVNKPPSAKEERKLRKPLIEKKRRERINNCLDQLKETVADAFRLDQSKLEKADILEMTVKHLQNIKNNKTLVDCNVDIEAQQKYSTGYIQCMHEVHTLLLTCEWMDKTLGARLLNHLLKSLPSSSEESRKAALRSPTLFQSSSTQSLNTSVSRTGIAASASPPRGKQAHHEDLLVMTDGGQFSTSSHLDSKFPGMLPPSPICGQQYSSSQQHNSILRPLDMWRPW
ncbi:enhancer of split m7 protein-like [Protopterus annectens]|uniref:enhancer of split m7 protein-like n=1 Tax=Protopterus annectens TaxID=7888 RepID=UPI001CFAFBE3|nr:enhancer of split m7 protein-like [Protopterus annectens]